MNKNKNTETIEDNDYIPTLYITRGIPGSGKSTLAFKMMDSNDNLYRVNRDDLRQRYFKAEVLPSSKEKALSKIQNDEVEMMLSLKYDVIVDDTGLVARFVREWEKLATKVGAKFEIINVEVSLETALARNQKRADEGGRFVPPAIIKDKFQRFTRNGKLAALPKVANPKTLMVDIVPYVADTSKPRAWIFDMDGTLSLFAGLRGPYEWSKVGGDAPHEHVVRLAKMAVAQGDLLLVTSARDGVCEPETRQWLKEHDIPAHSVFMRKAGDMRKDSIVKNELFNAHIRDHYNIVGVVDDRLQVCRLWFDLGLPLFRVGDPEAVF